MGDLISVMTSSVASICSELTPDEPKRNVWPLTRHSAEAAVLLTPFGTVNLSLQWNAEQSRLRAKGMSSCGTSFCNDTGFSIVLISCGFVLVESANGLPPMDTNGIYS